MDVFISSNNNLLVLGHLNSGICTFTLDGQKLDTPVSCRGQLLHPYSLATDSNGFILVADTGNHRVAIFDEDGKFLHSFGCHGSADGQFDTPRGIALSPTGSIYVTDAKNKKVQLWFYPILAIY